MRTSIWNHTFTEGPEIDVCYLLHFPNFTNPQHHYLGTCKLGRIKERMFEHALGRGAAFTRRMCEINTHFYIAKLWVGAGPERERQLKQQSGFKRHCCMCTKEPLLFPIAKIAIPKVSDEKKAIEAQLLDLQFPASEGWRDPK